MAPTASSREAHRGCSRHKQRYPQPGNVASASSLLQQVPAHLPLMALNEHTIPNQHNLLHTADHACAQRLGHPGVVAMKTQHAWRVLLRRSCKMARQHCSPAQSPPHALRTSTQPPPLRPLTPQTTQTSPILLTWPAPSTKELWRCCQHNTSWAGLLQRRCSLVT